MNTETTTTQSDDNELVSELIESMYGGIALMKQGQTKATDSSVKELAKKLETEHTKLTDDLKSLAAKKGGTVATAESSSDMKKREDMADDQVADYQKEWLEALKDRHETNIGKLEGHSTTDADLQAASTKGLPKLKELLANIESIQDRVK
jgi:putative membrane protein